MEAKSSVAAEAQEKVRRTALDWEKNEKARTLGKRLLQSDANMRAACNEVNKIRAAMRSETQPFTIYEPTNLEMVRELTPLIDPCIDKLLRTVVA